MIYYMGEPIHCKIKSVTLKENGKKYNVGYWCNPITGVYEYIGISDEQR